MKVLRILFWLVIVSALVAGVYVVVRVEPIDVDVAQVTQGEMEVTVRGEGMASAKEVHTVTAPLNGRMHRVTKKAGDVVVAGETVLASFSELPPALLDDRARSQAQAGVRAARAALGLAEAEKERVIAELANAKISLQRTANLLERGLVPAAQLDDARTSLATLDALMHRADAEIRLRKHEIEVSQAALNEPSSSSVADVCCVDVLSPVSGHVLRVLRDSEGVINAGTPLLEIADTSSLEAVVELLSTDAVQVSVGASARIEAWGGGVSLPATVRVVEPYAFTKVSALGVEEQRVRVILDFTDSQDEAQALGHGYRIAARIAVWQAQDAFKVPVSALFRTGKKWSVFVVNDDEQGQSAQTASLREVEIGQMNDEHAQVIAGLKPNEVVVRYPPSSLREGDAIVAR